MGRSRCNARAPDTQSYTIVVVYTIIFSFGKTELQIAAVGSVAARLFLGNKSDSEEGSLRMLVRGMRDARGSRDKYLRRSHETGGFSKLRMLYNGAV